MRNWFRFPGKPLAGTFSNISNLLTKFARPSWKRSKPSVQPMCTNSVTRIFSRPSTDSTISRARRSQPHEASAEGAPRAVLALLHRLAVLQLWVLDFLFSLQSLPGRLQPDRTLTGADRRLDGGLSHLWG